MIRRKQSVKTSARSETAKGELSLADLASVVGGLTASPGRRPDVDPVHMLLLDETHPGEAGEALGYAASKSAAESAASEKGVSAPAVPAGTNLEKAVPPVATADRLVAAAADKTLSDRSTGGMATAEVPKPNPGAPPAERAEPEQAARSPANTGLSAGQEAGKAGADVGTRGIAVGQAAAAPAMPGLDSSVVAKSAVASDPIKVASELAAQQDDGPQAVAGGEPDIAETGAADAGPFKGDHKAVQDAAHKFAAENPDAVNAMANKAKLEMEAAEKALKYPHGVFSPYHWRNEQAEMNRFVSIVYAKKAELVALKGWTDADAKAAGDGNKDAQAKIAASVAAFAKVAVAKDLADTAAAEKAATEKTASDQAANKAALAHQVERLGVARFAEGNPVLMEAALKKASSERAAAEKDVVNASSHLGGLSHKAAIDRMNMKTAAEAALKGWTTADAAAADRGDAAAKSKISTSMAAIGKVAADHAFERNLVLDFIKASPAMKAAADKIALEKAPLQQAWNLAKVKQLLAHGISCKATPEMEELERGIAAKTSEEATFKGWTESDSSAADHGDEAAQAKIAASMDLAAKYGLEAKLERDMVLVFAKTNPAAKVAAEKFAAEKAYLERNLAAVKEALKAHYRGWDGVKTSQVIELEKKIAGKAAQEMGVKGWTEAEAAAADRGDKAAQSKIAASMAEIIKVRLEVHAERAVALEYMKNSTVMQAAADKATAELSALREKLEQPNSRQTFEQRVELGAKVEAKDRELRALTGWTEARAAAADRGDADAIADIEASMKVIGKYATDTAQAEAVRKAADRIAAKDRAYTAGILSLWFPDDPGRRGKVAEGNVADDVPDLRAMKESDLVRSNVAKLHSTEAQQSRYPEAFENARQKAALLEANAKNILEQIKAVNPFAADKDSIKKVVIESLERLVAEKSNLFKALSGVSDADFRAANGGDEAAKARLDAASKASSKVASAAFDEAHNKKAEDFDKKEGYKRDLASRYDGAKKEVDRARNFKKDTWGNQKASSEPVLDPITQPMYIDAVKNLKIAEEPFKFQQRILKIYGGDDCPPIKLILEEMAKKPIITDELLAKIRTKESPEWRSEFEGLNRGEVVSKLEKEKADFDQATLARAVKMNLHSDAVELMALGTIKAEKNKLDAELTAVTKLQADKVAYAAALGFVAAAKDAAQKGLSAWNLKNPDAASTSKAEIEVRDRLQLTVAEKTVQGQGLQGWTDNDKVLASKGDKTAQAKITASLEAFKAVIKDVAEAKKKAAEPGDSPEAKKNRFIADESAEKRKQNDKPKYEAEYKKYKKEEGEDQKPASLEISLKRTVVELLDSDLFDHLRDDKGNTLRKVDVVAGIDAKVKTLLTLDGIDLGARWSISAKATYFQAIRDSHGNIVGKFTASATVDGGIESTFQIDGKDGINIVFKPAAKASAEASLTISDKYESITIDHMLDAKAEATAEAKIKISTKKDDFGVSMKREIGGTFEARYKGVLKGKDSANAIGGAVGISVGLKTSVAGGMSGKNGILAMNVSFELAAGLGFTGSFELTLDTKRGIVPDMAEKAIIRMIPFSNPGGSFSDAIFPWIYRN